jgi:hypothetical protein
MPKRWLAIRAFIVILIAGLAVAACGSGGFSLEDAVALRSDSVPLPRPAPKFAAVPVAPNWRHVPEPVSGQQLDQDKAKCTKMAHSTPGVGSPEMKFYLAFTNCMHAEGYEAISRL